MRLKRQLLLLLLVLASGCVAAAAAAKGQGAGGRQPSFGREKKARKAMTPFHHCHWMLSSWDGKHRFPIICELRDFLRKARKWFYEADAQLRRMREHAASMVTAMKRFFSDPSAKDDSRGEQDAEEKISPAPSSAEQDQGEPPATAATATAATAAAAAEGEGEGDVEEEEEEGIFSEVPCMGEQAEDLQADAGTGDAASPTAADTLELGGVCETAEEEGNSRLGGVGEEASAVGARGGGGGGGGGQMVAGRETSDTGGGAAAVDDGTAAFTPGLVTVDGGGDAAASFGPEAEGGEESATAGGRDVGMDGEDEHDGGKDGEEEDGGGGGGGDYEPHYDYYDGELRLATASYCVCFVVVSGILVLMYWAFNKALPPIKPPPAPVPGSVRRVSKKKKKKNRR
eukprot:g15337.t1